jgi:hypothetical protein
MVAVAEEESIDQALVSRVVDSLMHLGSSRSSDQQFHYHEYEANQ